jgi:uncharacterized RDD family membrane protein YckC
MKCPKCGYLGFETTERCRHCGYDFSLSMTAENGDLDSLPLRHSADREAPLADLDLTGLDTATAVATPPSDEIAQLYALEPPPARTPLAVRRSTPEVPRRRTPRMIKRDVEESGLQLEPAASAGDKTTYREAEDVAPAASAVRRVSAAVVDGLILAGINAAALYLTLAIAGLSMAEWRVVPAVPMVAFLLLLNAGYLIAFTASNGQTIGKMMTGIRVIADHGGRVDIAGAALRALGALICVALVGLPYLPVLLSHDGRALHDRLAGTRVIKHA